MVPLEPFYVNVVDTVLSFQDVFGGGVVGLACCGEYRVDRGPWYEIAVLDFRAVGVPLVVSLIGRSVSRRGAPCGADMSREDLVKCLYPILR